MAPPAGAPLIGVALKRVDLRPEVDPLTGTVNDDRRSFGCSTADQAALEWALLLAERWGGTVRAVSAGGPAATSVLRDAVSVGAHEAVLVDLRADAPSEEVAVALAGALDDAALICCGDLSWDRGSGSVPAFLAARLGLAQALGLVDLQPGETPGELTAVRRLDHGRREVLAVSGRAVLSFEGASADLRRAPLAAVLAARDAEVGVRPRPTPRADRVRVVRRSAYRPRPRVTPAPAADLDVRERILSITGALVDRTPPRKVQAEPAEAADLLLEQLRAWGYLG